MTRVGVLGVWHETNTYSARPTGIGDVRAHELLRGDDIIGRHPGTESVIGGMLATRPECLMDRGFWRRRTRGEVARCVLARGGQGRRSRSLPAAVLLCWHVFFSARSVPY
jgi:Metallopeptidase family M81